MKLKRRQKYLQIALNSTLQDARTIISRLPASENILIEAGTPLIKEYGMTAVSKIRYWAPRGSYIVADNKCADLGAREVEMMARAGANAATCLGVAPVETIDSFIAECQKFGLDSMLDMMNVSDVLTVLRKLKKIPDVVILHRGVDESEFSKEKQIPFYQIKQIKGNFKTLVSVAGGDTINEVQRAIFNDADIVVIWKAVYQASESTLQLVRDFLKEIGAKYGNLPDPISRRNTAPSSNNEEDDPRDPSNKNNLDETITHPDILLRTIIEALRKDV